MTQPPWLPETTLRPDLYWYIRSKRVVRQACWRYSGQMSAGQTFEIIDPDGAAAWKG